MVSLCSKRATKPCDLVRGVFGEGEKREKIGKPLRVESGRRMGLVVLDLVPRISGGVEERAIEESALCSSC